MYNRVLISFIIILSATFLFTENQDKLDFSGLKKIISNNAINTKKLESMKLREKNRLTKKISKNSPSKVNYPAEPILSKQLSPLPFDDKKNIHLKTDYRLEKLTYMQTYNLKNIHQYNNSIKYELSLQIKYPIVKSNNNRDCSACEFDFTNYGSECCDSAWDEYELNCAELEMFYNWDCSGCECPGDVAGECGDGTCNIDENCETCEADCGECGECDEGYVNDCEDNDCCPESWIADGLCDGEDQQWGCNLVCYDNDGGDCPWSCEVDGEVTCWDGSCALTEDDCPPTCEEQGGIVCWDGSCAIDVECPPEPECDAGYVADCADDDCCPEGWIGDGLCDGVDQGWGCDLSCYNCDGGDCDEASCTPCEDDGLVTCWNNTCAATEEDCPEITCYDTDCGYFLSFGSYTCQELEGMGYDCSLCDESGECPWVCEDDGLVTCWDNSCVENLNDCPEADCTEAGGYENWIADGFCDSSNNIENCDWDGGDCCGSTCLNSTYDCGSDATWAACNSVCLDPDGNDDCCETNDCPFTCEGNGLVTCWDNSCAETEEDCPEITCSDTTCGYYIELGYTCQEVTGNWGYDCSLCEETGECPWVCEDDGLLTCWDGSCVESFDDCPDASCSESGGIESWISDGYCDNSNNIENCDWDGGDCCGSTCLNSTYDCGSDATWAACNSVCLDPDGNDDCCETNDCPFTCEGDGLVTCWDNSCAETEEDCPEITCADTDCGYVLSWSAYTCQEIIDMYGYDCTLCYETDQCPIECEDEGLVTCWDSSCAVTEEDCPEFYCQDGYIEDCAGDGDCCPENWIGDGFADCTDQAYGCDLTCYDCDGGDCPDSDCSTCEDDGSVTCWDGSCAASEDDCPLTCEDQGGTDCWDGSCAIGEDCPDQPECDTGLIVDCDGSGDCFSEGWIGDGLCDGNDQAYGADLCCYDFDGGDCTEEECSNPACGDGECNGDETEADCPEDCVSAACGDGECNGDETEADCPEDCCVNELGDVNEDGMVNVLDIVQVVNHILGSNILTDCALESSDLNGDGMVNVLDIVQLSNIILNSGS